MKTKKSFYLWAILISVCFGETIDDEEVKNIDLGELKTTKKQFTYQEGSSIDSDTLGSISSGNGDITSALKMLPNVQYDSAQNASTTPGEIDPANISISGGLFYQNLFIIDGMNMNNDLDPNGGTTNNQTSIRGGRSQGMAVDTSLVESINVLDSNVSAAYGGFSGGVVEVDLKKPSYDSWHWDLSWQYTTSQWTQYYIDESAESYMATSADENYQPNFRKNIFRASTSGYIIDDLGIIASYSTTRSVIPLAAYRSLYSSYGDDVDSGREQKRQIDNYYIKLYYTPIDSLLLEGSVAYMPQDNTYYNSAAKDSYYDMESGGIQSALKATWETSIGTWINSINYSMLENSRRSDKSYFYQWRRSTTKNWGGTNSIVFEGGYGDVDQRQNTLDYKSDFLLNDLTLGIWTNAIKFGIDLSYQNTIRNRLTDLTVIQGNPTIMTGDQTCASDDPLCSMGTVSSSQSSVGQYATQIRIWRAGKYEFDTFAYGAYLEDDMKFDFSSGGELNARFGLRFDGDSYMSKHTVAPRFSLNYIAPWAKEDFRTTFIAGANRYYGRNLLSYRIYAASLNNYDTYTRSIDSSTNMPGEWAYQRNTQSSSYEFSKLKVPYSDEFMGGISQNLGPFSIVAKYIFRDGRDEIMQRTTSSAGYYWSNEGKSKSHVITLSLQNDRLLELGWTQHSFLFAFDWTQVDRSYNTTSTDETYIENPLIYYDGKLINYNDRPTENYVRPWTLRLNTIHTLNLPRMRFTYNNFFRYRSQYERMVLCSNANTCSSYMANYADYTQYTKMNFKGAFTWDIRFGAEFDLIDMGHIFYVNVDILNVLNSKNMTALYSSGSTGSTVSGIASSTAIPVYEVGRQAWLQFGYKF